MGIPRIKPDDYPSGNEGEEREHLPDGEYSVVGFSWSSTDDSGRPCLVNKGNDLVGRVKLVQSTGNPGPSMSLRLEEMRLLVKGFGGDPSGLEVPGYDSPTAITNYMREVERLGNAPQKVIKVNSRGGWTNLGQVKAFALPEGFYYWRIADIGPRNQETGEPEHKTSNPKWAPWFIVSLEVVGDAERNGPSEWNGCIHDEFMSYALLLGTNGELSWRLNSDGALSAASYRQNRIMELTAPSVFGATFDDANNVLPEWRRAAKAEGAVIKAYLGTGESGKKKGKRILTWGTLGPANYQAEPAKTVSSPATSTGASTPGGKAGYSKETAEALRLLFREFFNMTVVHFKKEPAFEGDTWELTAGGKALASKVLAPLANKLSTRLIAEFEGGDLDIAIVALSGLLSEADNTPAFVADFIARYEIILTPGEEDSVDEGNGGSDEEWEIPF